jgi:phage shock protein A
MGKPLKKSLKFLRDAEEDLKAAINRMEKATKELSELVKANPSATDNLAAQEQIGSINKLISNTKAELTDITRLIERMDKDS